MRPSTLDYLDKMRIIANMEPDWIDPEVVDRVWSKDIFKPKRWVEAEIELNNPLAGVSSITPPSLAEVIDAKVKDAVKTASNSIDTLTSRIATYNTNNTSTSIKEDAFMPTKNPEYFMKLLENAGMTNVSAEYSYTPYCCGTEVKFHGLIPDEIRLNTNKKEYNTMYNNRKSKSIYIKPTGIIRRDDTTRVDWEDGTHTVIVRDEKSPELDMFYTFCIAFTKKIMGSTGAIMNTIKASDTDAIEKARKEAIAKANKEAEEEAKKLKEAMEKAEFEASVKAQMFDHKVREEAIRRIMERENKRTDKAVSDVVSVEVTKYNIKPVEE